MADRTRTKSYIDPKLLRAFERGDLAEACRLLSRTRDPASIRRGRGQNDESLLHYACKNGWLAMAKELVESCRCDPESRDQEGWTPLLEACVAGHIHVAKYLVGECGCSTSCPTGSVGETVLHKASRQGHTEVVRYLLEQNDPDCVRSRNKYDELPLHLASEQGHLDIVKLLFTLNCADAQCPNSDGDTPLHIACSYNRIDVVRFLLSTGGVDPSLKNAEGETAIELTNNYEIVNMLTQFIECTRKYPLKPAAKIFIFGNPGAGKTTLVKVIRNKLSDSSGLSTFAGQLRRVSGIKPQTAGISVVGLECRKLGNVSFHDLAGQFEYYSSHDALIQNLMTSATALFLVVVKLDDPDAEMIRILNYWLSFIGNCCSQVNATAHVIVVGSYKDKAKAAGAKTSEKWTTLEKSCILTMDDPRLQFQGFAALNCRKLASRGLDTLCVLIQASCTKLQKLQESCARDHLLSHLLYAFLKARFSSHLACSVGELSAAIATTRDTLLPSSAHELTPILSTLSDDGHLLYLPNERVHDGWVITDKQALLSEINGTIFAPENFREYHSIATSTGVVPKSKIATALPSHDAEMIAGVLTQFEFCQKIRDESTLSLITASDPSTSQDTILKKTLHETYYFFPALVHVNRPLDIWQSLPSKQYRCGWYLKCSKNGHYFTPRFLHVLLLRLAFTFALAPNNTLQDEASPVLRRRCTIWRNGIQWLNQDATETNVEVAEQHQSVLLLMTCLDAGKEMACVRHRSSFIRKILEVKAEFCPGIPTKEYLINPASLSQYPQSTANLSVYNMEDVKRTLLEGSTYIVDPLGRTGMNMDVAFHFEPYLGLSEQIVVHMLDKKHAHEKVETSFLSHLATALSKKMEDRLEHRDTPQPTVDKFLKVLGMEALICEGQSSLTDLYFRRLCHWRDTDLAGGTYESLRSRLGEYSIFGNGKALASAISASSVKALPVSLPLPQGSQDDVDDTHLGIESLLEVRTELKPVTSSWAQLGLALGLLQPTLDEIEMSYGHSGHSLTETVAAWLQMKDNIADPSWKALCAALHNPTVHLPQLSRKIAAKHKKGSQQESSQDSRELRMLLEKVPATHLDLLEVESALTGGGHFSWFDLGLALGLLYGTLKRTEIENHYNFQGCLTDVLKMWLQQKDRVGLPSWQTLVRTLTHPLISQWGLAQQIVKSREKNLFPH